MFETYHDVSATDHDRILHEQYLIFDYIILLMHAESTLKSYTSFWMTPFFLLLVYWVYRNIIQARVRWSIMENQCHLCPTWPPLAANPGIILSILAALNSMRDGNFPGLYSALVELDATQAQLIDAG